MDRLFVQHDGVRASGSHAHTYSDMVWNSAGLGTTITNGDPDDEEMRRLTALIIALLFFALPAFAQNYDFPSNPTLNQIVIGPASQQFKWDGAKWVALFTPAPPMNFAPLLNPTGGQNNYAPLTNPNFSGTIFQGGTPLTGLFAPLANPTGGQNNYAPLTNPNFSGSITVGGQPVQVGGPWLPVNNPTFSGVMNGPDYNVTGSTDTLTWSQPQFGIFSTFGTGYGAGGEGSSFLIGQNMNYTGGYPNSWTRGLLTEINAPAAGSIQMYGAATVITGDTGLAVGQAFLPTMLFSISPVAYTQNSFMGNVGIPVGAAFNNLPVGVTGNLNGDLNFTVTNTNAGGNAGANFWGTNGTDWIGWSVTGGGYTAPGGPRAALLWTSAPNNLTIQADYSSIHMVTQGSLVGSFFRSADSHFQGLILPGFDGFGINGFQGPSLSIGNAYIGGETWSNIDISGAAYFNPAGGNWLADGGAGGGSTLFQLLNNGNVRMFGAGSMGAGTVIAWQPVASWNMAGMQVTHLENHTGYGVPNCVNCLSIPAYSRDSFGYVQISGSWPITLNFAKSFDGSVICTGNTLAQPPNQGVVSFSNNTTTSVNIWCNLSGGAACSMQTGWISYHCFGGSP